MPRSRDRVLGNLESIYREAYERAKAASDQVRMADIDAAYQREQLLLEVLLDIRDALASPPTPVSRTPLPHARGLHSEGRRHHHPRNGLDRPLDWSAAAGFRRHRRR